ncbi:hypothetical protein [Iningainema tapete]|uniref:hypothetical protein n=1 Tax=Iningainema tapete TaxID=2806730 RepID=UPI0030D7E6AA
MASLIARLKEAQRKKRSHLPKLTSENQLANGELVTIEIDQERSPQETDPWIKHMGIFADDPTFDDFLAEVAAYRQLVDAQEVE